MVGEIPDDSGLPPVEIAVPGMDDRSLTLEQLRSFVAVVQCGGFQQAGTYVCRSQSAVTQNIKKLEDSLECSLLIRKQGRLQGVTPEGKRLFQHALGVLKQMEQVIDSFKKPALSGRVRLGVPDDFELDHLHMAVSRCLAVHPSLCIDIVSTVSSELQSRFRQNSLDIAIYKIAANLVEDATEREILHSEPLCWVAHKPVEFKNLTEVPLVVFPEGCAYRQIAMQQLEKAGKTWRFAYMSASYDNIRRAVDAGLGIAILPRSALTDGQVALASSHSFPALPMISLVMEVSRKQDLYRQVADELSGNRPAPYRAQSGYRS